MDVGNESSLSTELEDLIRTLYAPEARPGIRAALLEYGAGRPEADRVQFDLLHLGGGDAARLQKLAEVARKDPRDVMSREYFWRAGRSYPHAWAKRHPVNSDSPDPPPLDIAVIAQARLRFQTQTRLERLSASSKPNSLLLAVAGAGKLLDLVDRTLALMTDGDVVDLTSVLEYHPGGRMPKRTLIHRLSGANPEMLTYEGDVLSWNGVGSYWKECSDKLVDLARSAEVAEMPMMRDAADQQVMVGFRPSTAGPKTHKLWY